MHVPMAFAHETVLLTGHESGPTSGKCTLAPALDRPGESGSKLAPPGVGPRLSDGSVMSPGRTAPFSRRTQEVRLGRENVVAPVCHTVPPPRGTVEVPGGD